MNKTHDMFSGLINSLRQENHYNTKATLDPIVTWVSAALVQSFDNQLAILNNLYADVEQRTEEDNERIKNTEIALKAARKQFGIMTCEHIKDISLLELKDGTLTCKKGCGMQEKVNESEVDMIKYLLSGKE